MRFNFRYGKSHRAFRFSKSYNLFVVFIALIFISACSFFPKAEQSSVLDITDFGIKPGTGENAIFAVQAAIEKAKSIEGEVLIKFPVGRYDFRADSSHTKTYYKSKTTDNNPKNLALLIEKCQNLIIDGRRSDFIFHGPIQPFSIDNSKNITIKNVNIDWDIPLTAQAEVVSATNKIIELKIDTLQFPYVIENNIFHPFDYPVLYAKSFENIDFINNKIKRSKRFKDFHKRKYTLSFEACKGVKVSGNKFESDVLGKNILLEIMSENEISAQKEFQLIVHISGMK